MADTTAPLGLLDHLAAFALAAFPGHSVAPSPQFVLTVLECELTRRSRQAFPGKSLRDPPGTDRAFT
jgi:hypothetical protein